METFLPMLCAQGRDLAKKKKRTTQKKEKKKDG